MASSKRFRSLFAAIAAAAVAGAGTGPASAQQAPARKDAPARDPSAQRVLTPEQLRACLARRDQLREQTDATVREKGAIDAGNAELDRVTDQLGAEAATIDRSSASAVDAYNARVQERRKALEDAQARMVAYNGKVESVQKLRQEYEKACENRRYDERDLDDLKRPKK